MALATQPATFDLVIRGGRSSIRKPTSTPCVTSASPAGGSRRCRREPLTGRERIDARGLVVSPGFIDLHTHVNDAATYRLAAQDGVTTALELEIGVPDVAAFYDARRGKAAINFGTSASHPWARVRGVRRHRARADAIVPPSRPRHGDGRRRRRAAGDAARGSSTRLDAGALGIGMGLVYTPGATRVRSRSRSFASPPRAACPVFVHVRSSGRLEPGSSIESVGEVIAAAAVTGASLHIVHINSSCTADAPECLQDDRRRARRAVSTSRSRAIPYGAGMTDLKSSVFNPGWQQKIGVTEHDVAIPETGERLTAESFARYRAQPGSTARPHLHQPRRHRRRGDHQSVDDRGERRGDANGLAIRARPARSRACSRATSASSGR